MRFLKIGPHKSGYTVFCPPMDVKVPEGVSVYYVKECEPIPGRIPYMFTHRIDGKPVTTIKKGEGVILRTELSEIVFKEIENAEPIPGNLLVGTLTDLPFDEERKEAYIFTGKEIDGKYRIGFYPWCEGTLAEGCSYLQL